MNLCQNSVMRLNGLQVESLRNELEVMKAKYEKVEREKSDILLRRLASLDTTPTKTAASEVCCLMPNRKSLKHSISHVYCKF